MFDFQTTSRSSRFNQMTIKILIVTVLIFTVMSILLTSNRKHFQILQVHDVTSLTQIQEYSHNLNKPSTVNLIVTKLIRFRGYNYKYRNCVFIDTADEKILNFADAVLFEHGSTLPKVKQNHQKYILFAWESQMNLGKIKYNNSIVDWIMSYDHNADIVAPYGYTIKCNGSNGDCANQIVSGPSAYFEYGNSKKDFNYKEKSKNAAWFVSNCKSSSKREDYVNDLKKYIDVDIYGACGHHQCPRTKSSDCYRKIEKEYKFYLSFENSLCRDYVTEKLFNILDFMIIPVVYGAANYSSFMPPNSYINALEHSPESLAKLMTKIGSSETLYRSYFSWKSMYKFTSYNFLDNVCDKLNDENHSPRKLHVDYFNDEKLCKKGFERRR